jgi:hypothetical protein
MSWVAAALVVVVCAIAVRAAASTGGNASVTPPTFASAGIDCAPSPGATEQVFLDVHATDKEIIVARLAIASLPGVTIDQYLDHRDALAQLACIFPGSPAVLHGTRPVDLPVSFAVTADAADATTTRLREIPNVLGVVTPASWSSWVQRIDE